jgi:hypothetical protein
MKIDATDTNPEPDYVVDLRVDGVLVASQETYGADDLEEVVDGWVDLFTVEGERNLRDLREWREGDTDSFDIDAGNGGVVQVHRLGEPVVRLELTLPEAETLRNFIDQHLFGTVTERTQLVGILDRLRAPEGVAR